MKRYLIIGFAIFIGCVISFAPAGLMRTVFEPIPDVDLVEPRGSIWHGTGVVHTKPLGQIDIGWKAHFASILTLSPAYAWSAQKTGINLHGDASYRLFDTPAIHVKTQGHITAQPINDWLQVYDIEISGDLDVAPTVALLNNQGILQSLNGQIHWSGGLVRYTLSGVLHEVILPPLTATFTQSSNGAPEAIVTEQGDPRPLILANMGENGFAKVGMTKRFTTLLNTPWPGNDPDDKIVLQVEEKLF